MVGGWRRAFCTTISKDREPKIAVEKKNDNDHSIPSPRLSSRFGFFSNPSTPRLKSEESISFPNLRCKTTSSETITTASAPVSPRLHCKTTKNSPRFFFRSNPSSPKSPSSFSFLRTKTRISKSTCGICSQSLKTGQGMAIFTAECSHGFHFPCVAANVRKQGSLVCPVCNAQWTEVPSLVLQPNNRKTERSEIDQDKLKKRDSVLKNLKIYNDDEPLMSPGRGFVPILESDEDGGDENETVEEFQGFFVNNNNTSHLPNSAPIKTGNVNLKLLPASAVISVGRSYETYAVVLKVQALASPVINLTDHCAPIDLVTVIDVSGRMTGEKQQSMKRAMRFVISSLSSNDRLSIIAFSGTSKRLTPLKRMTANGRRSARRIIDALGCVGKDACAADAVKKAEKVLEDRRDQNIIAAILLLSNGCDNNISTNSNPDRSIRIHKFGFSEIGGYGHAPIDDVFAKCFRGWMSVVNLDLRLELGFVAGSAPAQISAIYSVKNGEPNVIGPGSIRLGDLFADEERELLIELKVPISAIGSHHVLTVRSSYNEASSQKLVINKEQVLLVPRPHAARSSAPNIERLRRLFISTRAIAESRRLIERSGDFSGAYQLLYSARALLSQSKVGAGGDEYSRGLEVELAELNYHRHKDVEIQRLRSVEKGCDVYVDEKDELLTPTSAWKAAERLAKVAIMRKSLNRVSDLHGFENARF